jgi:hypothetical protein
MKKIYYIEYGYEPELSLSETIEDCFDNFSLDRYKELYIDDDNRNMFVDDLYSAQNWNDDDLTCLQILEYSLSEDDLFQLLIGDSLSTKPTNTWYYWWDNKQRKLKEIPKAFI